jgi:chaperone required for assembly of F1-ATPase
MKRFWKEATSSEVDNGHTILIDGRQVMTPAQRKLSVPTKALAVAIVKEWASVQEKLDPATMPMTGLANAALDRVAPARQEFARGLSRFAENEMCCYRADQPDGLVERQAQAWDRLIDWASKRYDIGFTVTSGVMHAAQPAQTLERLSAAVASEDDFHLAGLSPMVTAGQSLLVALAVRHGAVSPDEGWQASQIEEEWQIEHWGADDEATKAAEARRADFMNGARFLSLL